MQHIEMSSIFVIGLPEVEKMRMGQKNTFLMSEKRGERHKLIIQQAK